MPMISIFDWSQYTLPSTLSTAQIEGNTYPNDPGAPKYDSASPSWIGADFTFLGGAPTELEVLDDDPEFQDGYVETGGPQTLAAPVTIGGVTYPAGSIVENEFSMLDAAGNEIFVVRIAGVNVGFTYPVGQEPQPNDVFTGLHGRDGAAEDSFDGISGSAEPYAGVICFAAGTLIATPDGPCAVETLRPGDMVVTHDRGVQPLIWVGHRRISLTGQDTTTLPVQIAAGALGDGLPLRNLVVSPQHQLLMKGPEVSDTFGEPEVLAPAKGLVGMPGVRQVSDKREILYVHVMLDHHALLRAEGVLTESFYPGPNALRMMPKAHVEQITTLLPDLAVGSTGGYGPPVRPRLTCRQTRLLVSFLCANAPDPFEEMAFARYFPHRVDGSVGLRRSP